MTELNYTNIRRQLEEEKAEILKSVSGGSGLPIHMNPDRDDLAQDYITLEKTIALKAMEREQLEQVESALQRLDNGTYGLCSECSELIPTERLEILPYATLCVRCQTQHERHW
ncbi:MAG: TraR/DksA family transcriptional regulator [Anaerolineaceae bacterium]|nr:conjugal transfer protein TraR [Chloroflexota bacterium]UCC52095.1 MAG: TraR/DksA family transcriptional regulator [Anaerolineaceae bacterium]